MRLKIRTSELCRMWYIYLPLRFGVASCASILHLKFSRQLSPHVRPSRKLTLSPTAAVLCPC